MLTRVESAVRQVANLPKHLRVFKLKLNQPSVPNGVNNHPEDASPVNVSNGSVIQRPIVQHANQRITHATFINNTLNVASLGLQN